MSERENREWGRLWEVLFGEPQPITADVAMTAQVLVQHLSPLPPYEITPRDVRPAKPPRS